MVTENLFEAQVPCRIPETFQRRGQRLLLPPTTGPCESCYGSLGDACQLCCCSSSHSAPLCPVVLSPEHCHQRHSPSGVRELISHVQGFKIRQTVLDASIPTCVYTHVRTQHHRASNRLPTLTERLPPALPDMLQSLAEADGGSYSNESLPAAVATPPAPPVNGSAPAEIAVVYTAEEFQRAFHEGVRDIELRAHIDTRQLVKVKSVLVTDRNERVTKRFGAVPSTTRSIRVHSSPICMRHTSVQTPHTGTRMAPKPPGAHCTVCCFRGLVWSLYRWQRPAEFLQSVSGTHVHEPLRHRFEYAHGPACICM